MANIAFGRYSPRNTFTHRLDPRSKLLMVILLTVTIFLQFSTWSTTLIISGILVLFVIVLLIISKVSIKELFKSLAMMWMLMIFLFIGYIFIPMTNYTHVAFTIGTFNVYWDAIYQCSYIILRIFMMLSFTMILTSTTKPMELTYGLEWYMHPLKAIKFPSSEIAMTLSIALRFIPTLLEETNRIMKAQASRGVDFTRGGIFKRLKAVITLVIPLFVSSIERSEELSNAMEARGYDPKAKRTKYRKLHFSYRDLVSFVLVILLFAGVLTLFIFDQTGTKIDLIKFFFNVEVGF